MEQEPREPEIPHAIGENSGIDLRRSLARLANRKFKNMKGTSAHIDLGEHGEVNVEHVRFRDALEEGKLKVYIRQESRDPKVIATVVSLGLVAAGIYNLKHRRK